MTDAPIRLRILRYLGQEPANPAALARRLRLRPPTVIHYLDALCLARLVQVIMTEDGRRLYALRPGATTQLAPSLEAFLDPAAENPRTD